LLPAQSNPTFPSNDSIKKTVTILFMWLLHPVTGIF
jgi:hypothetical protein